MSDLEHHPDLTGWLLDVYPNDTNLTVWLIGDDGLRLRLQQDFSPTLYAAGPAARLRQLWQWLSAQPVPVHLARTRRTDVFHDHSDAPAAEANADAAAQRTQRLVTVLAVSVLQPARLDELFRDMLNAFPELTYYDADISVPLRACRRLQRLPAGTRCRSAGGKI